MNTSIRGPTVITKTPVHQTGVTNRPNVSRFNNVGIKCQVLASRRTPPTAHGGEVLKFFFSPVNRNKYPG